MGTLPLFDEPYSLDRAALAARLRALAADGILIGGRSWKYEGWLGQIYTPSRYSVRGRFSRKRFERECLAEYAEIFPIVGGDFSFYQFPSPEFWAGLFASAGAQLQFGLKIPEEITCRVFPTHPRYGPRAGLRNPSFLDADALSALFLEPLAPYRERIAVLMFEFGAFQGSAYRDPDAFLSDLDLFLEKLPRTFRYAVEIRNREFLQPGYFAVLRKHSAAHVFNAWTKMPTIAKQMKIEGAMTAGLVVARALLREGRPYEDAVALFSPYDRVQDENPETRGSLRELIRSAKDRKIPAYLFINNRLEGNAPVTIQSVAAPD